MRSPQIKWLPSGEPYSEKFNDIYFSQQNGLAETRYVFLESNRLAEKFKEHKGIFRIAETGFGTGLNFLATWQLLDQTQNTDIYLDFVSVEKYPLSKTELKQALSVWQELSSYSEKLTEAYPEICYLGTVQFQIAQNVLLTLIFDDATQALSNYQQAVDVWFLDGFAPSLNQDMWSNHLFKQIARLSSLADTKPTFATFTAASNVRKELIQAGFDVKKRKGFGKKREMLCGSLGTIEQKHLQQPIPKFYAIPNQKLDCNRKVAIIGAGLAGCAIAYELSKYHIQCDLFEKDQDIASGASGNPVGISHPYLSMDGNISDLLFTQGFLQLKSFLKKYASEDVYQLLPMCQLLESKEKTKFYEKLIFSREIDGDLVQLLSSQEINNQLGIFDNITSGVFYPESLAVKPKSLCKLWLELAKSHTTLYLDTQIINLKKENDDWLLSFNDNATQSYQAVILTGGYDQFKYFDFLNYMNCSPKPGQVDVIDNPGLQNILTNKNYFVPLSNEALLIGATFREGNDDLQFSFDDFKQNLIGLPLAADEIKDKPIYSRVSVRCASADHLPVIGGVVNQQEFTEVYQQNIKNGVTDNHLKPCPYENGLYIASAFGSKGLSASLISAQILRSILLGHSLPCSASLYKALHPSRYLIRSFKKNIV